LLAVDETVSIPGVFEIGAFMQIGIAAYLRNFAVRCNQIARNTTDPYAKTELERIVAELADKAEVLEAAFKVTGDQHK